MEPHSCIFYSKASVKLIKRLLLTLLFLLALAAILYAGYQQLPSFSGNWLQGQLEQADLKDVVVNIEQINPESADVETVAFNYVSADTRVAVNVDSVNLKWDWTALKNKRIKTAGIDSVKVTLSTGEGRQEAVKAVSISDVADWLALLQIDLNNVLPLDQLDIRHIEIIRLQNGVPVENIKGWLSIKKSSEEVIVTAHIESNDKQVDIDLITQPNRVRHLSVSNPQLGKLLSCETAVADRSFSLACDWAQALPEFLDDRLSKKAHWSGLQLNTQVQLSSVDDGDLNLLSGKAQISAENLHWNESDFEGVLLSLTFQLIEHDNYFEFSTIDSAEFTANKVLTSAVDMDELVIKTDFSANNYDQTASLNIAALTVNARRLQYADLVKAKDLKFDIKARLGQSDQAVLVIDAGSEISVGSISANGVLLNQGVVNVTKPLALVATQKQSVSLREPASILFSNQGLTVNSVTLQLASLAINLDTLQTGEPSLFTGSLSSKRLVTRLDGRPVVFTDIHQRVSMRNNIVSLSGKFRDGQREIELTDSMQHNIHSEQGWLNLAAETIQFSPEWPMATYAQPFELPISVIRGELNTQLRVNWSNIKNSKFKAVLDLEMRDLGGAWQEVYFSGMNGSGKMQVFPQMKSLNDFVINVDQIDAGIPLTSTQLNLRMAPSSSGKLPKLLLDSASMSLLGGKMRANKQAFDLNLVENQLQLKVDGLELKQIVSLHQVEGVDASGYVDGEIPIRLSTEGVSVDGGKVYARAPGGKIRYKADTSAIEKAAPGSNIVFDVLKDFDYVELKALPTYEPNGDLVLALSLYGNNKEVENGRPINLNINLEQNVQKLLQSLRYVDGLNEAIDKQVQEFYRNRAVQ